MNRLFKCRHFIFKNIKHTFTRGVSCLYEFQSPSHYFNEAHKKALRSVDFVLSQPVVSIEAVDNLLTDLSYDISYCSSRFSKFALDKFLEIAKKRNVELTIDHINNIMDIYITYDLDLNPVKILAEIQQRGLSFNNVTLEQILFRYCQLGDIDSANKVCERLKSVNCYINSTKIAWMIGCAIRANNTEEIIKWEEDLVKNNYTISCLGHSFIGESYAVSNNMEKSIISLEESNKKSKEVKNYSKLGFNMLYQMIKHDVSKEVIVQMLEYLKKQFVIGDFVFILGKLHRRQLYEGSLFLIDQCNQYMTNKEWKFLLNNIFFTDPPFEVMKSFLEKSDMEHPQTYLIRYIKPFEKALYLAEKQLIPATEHEKRIIFSQLMINAGTYEYPYHHINKVLKLYRNNTRSIDFHKFLVKLGIGYIISINPNLSYEKLIEIFNKNEKNFSKSVHAACIFHEICFGSLQVAKSLTVSISKDQIYNFQMDFNVYCTDLISFKTFEDLTERLVFLNSLIYEVRFRKFLTTFSFKYVVSNSVDDVQKMMSFLRDTFQFQLTENAITSFEHGKASPSSDQIDTLRNFQYKLNPEDQDVADVQS